MAYTKLPIQQIFASAAAPLNSAPIFGAPPKTVLFDGAKTLAQVAFNGNTVNWNGDLHFRYRGIPWDQDYVAGDASRKNVGSFQPLTPNPWDRLMSDLNELFVDSVQYFAYSEFNLNYMGTWYAEGKDPESGAETFCFIEAVSRDDAITQASARGIVVSKVSLSKGSIQNQGKRTPAYSDIISGAGMLKLFGTVCFIVSALFFAVGTVLLIEGMIQYSSDGFNGVRHDALVASISEFASGLVACIIFLIYGIVLRMFGAMAVAIRDIAQNSFK